MLENNLTWIEKIKQYCLKYDIPLSYLAEILNEPKVIPMVRGKAFEFSALLRLQQILPTTEWIVDKPAVNAQFGLHDVDIRVIHKPTRKIIRVECKLAGKGNFRLQKDGSTAIKVKCMRSRTLGTAKVAELSKKIGISEALLSVHNDQYLPTDFDAVITSIGNAFYETNDETDAYEWQPSKEGIHFLEQLASFHNESITHLQKFAYHAMYIAPSADLAITTANPHICTRTKCTDKQNCGFIPNYPIIKFPTNRYIPTETWHYINESNNVFHRILQKTDLRLYQGEI
jgi:hypothetical protein